MSNPLASVKHLVPATATAVAGACLSKSSDVDTSEFRKVSAKALELIAQTISYLLSEGAHSCLWCTFTFPAHIRGRTARQNCFNSWRTSVGNSLGKSVWVPEEHESGEIHFHGILYIRGANFSEGFNFKARERWVWSKSEMELALWMRSASPDLRAMWKEMKTWQKYGLGMVLDMVPLRPGTIPIAVARYMASYATQGNHPKGTRLVRRVGWKKGEALPLTTTMKPLGPDGEVNHKAKAVSRFSLVGERCSIFGKLKCLGDNGSRGRGWPVKAVIAGFVKLTTHKFRGWKHNYLETVDVLIQCLSILSRSPKWLASGAHKQVCSTVGVFEAA